MSFFYRGIVYVPMRVHVWEKKSNQINKRTNKMATSTSTRSDSEAGLVERLVSGLTEALKQNKATGQ